MKSMKTFVAVIGLLALSVDAQGGLFDRWQGCFGASKGCDCAPTFQPVACRPTITRPCHVNVYNYQRACAKPLCVDACAPAGACAPVGDVCAPGAVPPVPAVQPPAAAADCAPCPPACPPAGAACCPPMDCGAPCVDACVPACPAVDPAEIAQLIYESQTACYAKHRARALRRLGRRYDCVCNPEIMAAFVYALNDADEQVRAQAAHEISRQVRHNPGCCSQEVVCALQVALADCDRKVRRRAEHALRHCGYDVIDAPCDACDIACAPGCVHGGIPGAAPGAAPGAIPGAPPAVPAEEVDEDEPAPAPAPPAEEERAYFPKRIPQQSTRPTIRQSLSNLFSLNK